MFFKVIFKKKFIKNAFLTFFILGVNVFHTYDIMWPAPKTFWIRQWLGANITCLLMQWFLNFLKLGTSITFIGLLFFPGIFLRHSFSSPGHFSSHVLQPSHIHHFIRYFSLTTNSV